jgi:hypothetical protein
VAQHVTQVQGRYSAAGLNEREVEQFFLSFQDAIARGDKEKVAAMVAYPIPVSLASGRRVRVRNRADFLRNYERIFDRAFRRFILQTRVEDLWARWSGVATPRGEIWVNGIVRDESRPDEYEIKITTINGVFRGRN